MDSTSKTIVIAFSTFSFVFILGIVCGFLLGAIFNKSPIIQVNNYANCSVEKVPDYFPNYWNTISTGVVSIPNISTKDIHDRYGEIRYINNSQYGAECCYPVECYKNISDRPMYCSCEYAVYCYKVEENNDTKN